MFIKSLSLNEYNENVQFSVQMIYFNDLKKGWSSEQTGTTIWNPGNLLSVVCQPDELERGYREQLFVLRAFSCWDKLTVPVAKVNLIDPEIYISCSCSGKLQELSEFCWIQTAKLGDLHFVPKIKQQFKSLHEWMNDETKT